MIASTNKLVMERQGYEQLVRFPRPPSSGSIKSFRRRNIFAVLISSSLVVIGFAAIESYIDDLEETGRCLSVSPSPGHRVA